MCERFCRRCLLDAVSDADLIQQIRQRIDSLTADERAPRAQYESRLARCQACDQLIGGTCQRCGCFVQLRAAKRLSRCPDGQW